jgi:hypothetical protein
MALIRGPRSGACFNSKLHCVLRMTPHTTMPFRGQEDRVILARLMYANIVHPTSFSSRP